MISENRAGPSNLGNVISQILLCKQIAPDFNQEEIFSISKDTEDLNQILTECQKYVPQQDSSNGEFEPQVVGSNPGSLDYFKLNHSKVTYYVAKFSGVETSPIQDNLFFVNQNVTKMPLLYLFHILTQVIPVFFFILLFTLYL